MKPVAWSCWNEGMPCAVILVTEPDMYEWQSIKPLYTAPRELSDEEIVSEWIGSGRNFYAFAKTILKKASEK